MVAVQLSDLVLGHGRLLLPQTGRRRHRRHFVDGAADQGRTCGRCTGDELLRWWRWCQSCGRHQRIGGCIGSERFGRDVVIIVVQDGHDVVAAAAATAAAAGHHRMVIGIELMVAIDDAAGGGVVDNRPRRSTITCWWTDG